MSPRALAGRWRCVSSCPPGPGRGRRVGRLRGLFAGRGTLELDGVAIRVAEIDRRARSLRPVAQSGLACFDSMTREVRSDGLFVEVGERQGEMVDVGSVRVCDRPRRPCRAANRSRRGRSGWPPHAAGRGRAPRSGAPRDSPIRSRRSPSIERRRAPATPRGRGPRSESDEGLHSCSCRVLARRMPIGLVALGARPGSVRPARDPLSWTSALADQGRRRMGLELRAPIVALEGELDQAIEQPRVGQAGGLPELRVHRDAREAGQAVQLVDVERAASCGRRGSRRGPCPRHRGPGTRRSPSPAAARSRRARARRG